MTGTPSAPGDRVAVDAGRQAVFHAALAQMNGLAALMKQHRHVVAPHELGVRDAVIAPSLGRVRNRRSAGRAARVGGPGGAGRRSQERRRQGER